jgi:amino acid adenylation domain-containing protein
VSESLDIEDVYELSPLQQGLLFHSELDRSSGFYVEQYSCLLDGPLDVDQLERAWQDVVEAHPALRASFHWRDLEKPLQVVRRHLPIHLERHDWNALPSQVAVRQLEALLADDRRRGFDVSIAPLMRWSIVRHDDCRHRLVWSFHHLLIDGWSLQLVLGEVFARYDALAAGREFTAAEVPPYGDYVSWLQTRDQCAAERFWRRTLAGIDGPTPLGMSTTTAAPPAAADAIDEEVLGVGSATTAALAARAREWRVTPNALVLAAWGLLLGRYAGARDVVVGAVCSGRPPELEGVDRMVGAFANTLPLRLTIEPGAPVRRWVTEVQSRQLRALEFQWSPLVDVQGWTDVPRGTPLFENLFVFQSAPAEAARPNSGITRRDVRFTERTHLPLTLEAWLGDELTLSMFSDRHRFGRESVRGVLRQLASLLEAIAGECPACVADLPLLSDEERRRALAEACGAGTGEWSGPCFADSFAAQVERTPDAVAVSDGRTALSYRDLDARATTLAGRIRGAALHDGPVAVCLPRSTNFVVAVAALFTSGVPYLPLDPRLPAARLLQLVQDSGAVLVVTDASSGDTFTAAGISVLDVDEMHEAILQGSPCDRQSSRAPEAVALRRRPGLSGSRSAPSSLSANDLAYVIYTSGSTGRPKGAMVTHGGCANHLAAKISLLDLDASDVVAQTAPQAFDISIWQMLAPLLVGARVEVFVDEVAFDATRLLDDAAWRGVTVLEMVPSLLRASLEHAGASGQSSSSLRQLRWLMLTGESLPPDLARAWFAYAPAIPIVNAYGPTECSDDVTHHVIHQAPRPDDVRVPIGRAIQNTQLYVLDEAMQPLPPGAIGELAVGGAGVGIGYVGKPAATAAAFVPDPFSSRPGARLYRTGDRVRQRLDASLDFIGRFDHQVKIRGYRIEPDEVEAILAERPGVRQCAVIAAGAGDRAGLVAYVVAQPHAGTSARSLRDALRRVLPEYMVPAAFVFLDALPLTTNGKLDRGALPDPGFARADVESAAPRTPLEECLADIWSELLGVAAVGVDDDFFALGGHSLLAMRLLSRVNEAFDVHLTLRQVFDHPTIAALGGVVVEAQLDAIPEDELASLFTRLEIPIGGDVVPPPTHPAVPMSGNAI